MHLSWPCSIQQPISKHSMFKRDGQRWLWLICAIVVCFIAVPAHAQQIPGFVSQPLDDGGQQWSLSLQTLLFLSSLAFLPSMLLMMTSFTRIIIVLSLLRTAMGTQATPPNQVLLGIALFLTFLLCRQYWHKYMTMPGYH